MLNTLLTPRFSPHSGSCSAFRQMAESLVLLAIAVICFRGFAVEGYMISTGSMAPTLVGYHHQVVCPECSFHFARGTKAEANIEHAEIARADYEIEQISPAVARCPNCGFNGILADELPRTEGDQLLVHKHAFDFRSPRRWEVIVFRNPSDSRQAYVKRVVGLPGETIELVNGNVFINGVLARKPYQVQAATRLAVSSYAAQTSGDDPDCQSSWVPLQADSVWQLDAESLTCSAHQPESHTEISWIGYRHWIRSGGAHVTRVKLKQWPRDLKPLDAGDQPLRYENGELKFTGALSDIERRNWLARSDDQPFQQAIQQLFNHSHIAPITDEVGYNSSETSTGQAVNEFLISLTLTQIAGPGRFEIELSNGKHIYSAVFKFASGTIEILQDGNPVPIQHGTIPPDLIKNPLRIDFSLIDHQIILALNGAEAIPARTLEETERESNMTPSMRRPVRFGAASLNCTVQNLALDRDIYYTIPENSAHQFVMGPDEFFVLGDNSPVSVDSRYWPNPAVPRSSLIGKPMVVHLPSRSQRFQWRGEIHNVRMPDFSRIRLVR